MAGSIVLNIRGGVQLHVPRAIDQTTPYVLLEQDDWFEDEIRFVRALLRPGQKAIDIGANHGVYTAAIAKAVGSAGAVWAFEPTPATADLLAESLRPFPQARLLRGAVSDVAGTAHLQVGAASEDNALVGAAREGTLAVPAQPLDHLMQEHGWRGIDFVKIDAEGHEQQVIAGGREFFAQESPLVMFEAAVAGWQAAAAQLRALGYAFYRLLPGPALLVPAVPGEAADPFLINLFCCKPDRARQLARDGFLAAAPGLAGGTDAFALHRVAMDRSRSPEERYGALDTALKAATAGATPSLPALMNRIRIAADAGQRQLAYEGAKQLLLEFPRRWREAAGASFLAPVSRLDAVPARGEDLEWIACAAGEAGLAYVAYSSKFVGEPLLRVIKMLDGNPFRAPMTERRRQLIRMAAGLQQGPERHPLLETASEDNLNPAYWRGES
jgi:FkbM family methyltransferase